MNELSLLYNFLMVGAILFVLGLVGFLTRRNLIVMFLCAEMMLQGVSLSLIGFGRFHGSQLKDPTRLNPETMGAYGGQMLVIFSITVAQRTREFATLRTIGASRPQLLTSVTLEALIIGERSAATDRKTSLTDALHEHAVSV